LLSGLSHITAIGLVTPLGISAPHTWDALLAGRYITDHAKITLPRISNAPRVSLLAIRAASEAIASSGEKSLAEAALIVGTSKGPIEEWLKPSSTSSAVECRTDLGLSGIARDLAREFEIHGPRLTISTACASGLHALIRGAMLIQSGEVRRVLVVAAEASVHPLFIGSFNRLGILPPVGVGCRPFDQTRKGFLMSEAAAAVMLSAEPMDNSVLIRSFAMGADATHLTRNSDDADPLRQVLGRVCGPRPVDLIHAHGTGTEHNDATELAVLEQICGGGGVAPNLFSHKGALGHSLGAAGLVSVALNVMAHRNGVIPPNAQTHHPMPMKHVVLRDKTVRRDVRNSIAVAAGFGGQIAAVGLSTI
jgi:3-oxoacyl-[acyl-carrier-protein] synthase II